MKNINTIFAHIGGRSAPVASKNTLAVKYVLSMLFFASITSLAGAAPPSAEKSATRIEADGGVVVDQSITMIGEEFYRLFTTLWNEKPNVEAYSLLVRELPSMKLGSQILIESGQKRIFQAPLPTVRARVRELAEQAVEISYDSLVGADIQTLMFPEPDLGQDEM